MRRKDRQVYDQNEILSIINSCGVCRLAMVDGDAPYIVPMNFGYAFSGGALTLYFHSAGEGRKIDILRESPRVCFEMDCGHELVEGARACDYGYKYESIIGAGRAVFVEDHEEKVNALRKIMAKYTGKEDFIFPPDMVSKTTVFMVQADEYTAKRR